MVERYWFRPAHIGQNVVADPAEPVTGQPGTVGSKRAVIVTPVHPNAPAGGLAEAAPQQEPAPLRSGPQAIIGAGPQQPEGTFKRICAPQFVANGALAVPTTAMPVSTILLQPFQTGIIRNVQIIATNMLQASNASNVNIFLQSTYGEVYYKWVLFIGTSVVQYMNIYDTADSYVTFKNGLELVLTTANVAANTGLVNVNVVWEL